MRLMAAELEQCLEQQRAAHLDHPEPSYAERVADLKQLSRLLKDDWPRTIDELERRREKLRQQE